MIKTATVVRRAFAAVLVTAITAGLSACVTDPVYSGSSGYYVQDPYYSPGYYEPRYYGSGYHERVYYYPYPVYRDRPYPVYYGRPPGHDHGDHDGHDRSPPPASRPPPSSHKPGPSRPPIDRRPPRDPGPSVSDKPRGPDKPTRRPKDDEADGISRVLRDRVVRKER